MDLLETIKKDAIKKNKKIVLPEGTEERTLKAAGIILKEKIADIILIGNRDEIFKKAKTLNINNLEKAEIVNPLSHERIEEYTELLYNIRKHKGLMPEQAKELVKNPLYLGVLMIKAGHAHGEVAGAMNATGDVIRPALQIVKTKKGINVVSGAFIMMFKDKSLGDNGILVFANCAVHPDPTDKELAEIAISAAGTAKNIAKLEPRVAMLSFSTKGSAKHEMCDKIISATEIAKKIKPDLKIDGELQADAAIVESIGKSKAPGSPIAGNANVLVFPTLDVGNIAYKLVQRLAKAEAVGPVLQGMAAPINDLSRGCSVSDIVNLVAITSNQI